MWEGFIIIAALKWILPNVCSHMGAGVVIMWEGFVTFEALVRFLLCVSSKVITEDASLIIAGTGSMVSEGHTLSLWQDRTCYIYSRIYDVIYLIPNVCLQISFWSIKHFLSLHLDSVAVSVGFRGVSITTTSTVYIYGFLPVWGQVVALLFFGISQYIR